MANFSIDACINTVTFAAMITRPVYAFRYLRGLELLREQELRESELQRQITSQQAHIAAQRSIHEAVRVDRNLCSRQLIQSLEEMADLKQ